MSVSTARLGKRVGSLPRVARAIAATAGFAATAIGIVFGVWPRRGRPRAAWGVRRVRLLGPRLQGQVLAAAWQLVEARSGVQLDQSRDLRLKPEVSTDAGSWNVWVPVRRRARRMYVQIQLYNPAATVPIGRIRTTEFDRSQ